MQFSDFLSLINLVPLVFLKKKKKKLGFFGLQSYLQEWTQRKKKSQNSFYFFIPWNEIYVRERSEMVLYFYVQIHS